MKQVRMRIKVGKERKTLGDYVWYVFRGFFFLLVLALIMGVLVCALTIEDPQADQKVYETR